MDTIGFLFLGIRTEEFAILEKFPKVENDMGFNTEIQFTIYEETKEMTCFVSVEFIIKKIKLLKLKVACHFAVKPENWEDFTVENRLIVPKDFLVHLAMIAVGTTRGVLHAKTENTEYQLFAMPLIDVQNVITEDEIFELEATV